MFRPGLVAAVVKVVAWVVEKPPHGLSETYEHILHCCRHVTDPFVIWVCTEFI